MDRIVLEMSLDRWWKRLTWASVAVIWFAGLYFGGHLVWWWLR